MSDQPHRVPKYRCKKSNGRKYGCVSLPDGAGGRRDILLGKFGTRASRVEYARVIAEWEAAGQQLPAPNGQAPDLTVNELVLRFWKHAEQHYRQPDGAQTRELSDYKLSARPLVHLYGLERAGAFGPLALKAVRQKMIDGYEHPKHGPQPSLARGVINQRIGRIKRIFRWGVSEQLIHESVYSALCAVDGLKKGRTAARETAPVKPVPLAFVQATLPYLLPPVRAMVELQLATGMRPGEVCAMRTIDLDTSGAVWLYRPGSDQGPEGAHKTAWRGHQRVIAIGPKGQEIIKPWLRADLNERLFQPKDAVQLRCVALRQRRQTPLQPSQVDRRKKQPKRRPGECYSVAAYGLAIRRAIVRANETAEADCKPSIPQWHSNQVRHTRATEIRKRFGLDAARAVLGHRPPVVSEIYAELDSGLATEVMAKLG